MESYIEPDADDEAREFAISPEMVIGALDPSKMSEVVVAYIDANGSVKIASSHSYWRTQMLLNEASLTLDRLAT